MVFLSNLPEKYVGKQIEIDCVDVEIHRCEDNQPPIFKGPGIIRGDKSGRLSFKVYNQIQVNKEIFAYLRQVREENDPRKANLRLFAEGYDGMKWNGAWSIPVLNIFQSPYMLVEGEFDQLGARVEKIEGDRTSKSTELVFSDHFDLPLAGTVKVKSFHGEKVISTSFWRDHHEVPFDDSLIRFQKSLDETRLHVTASDGDRFTPPYVENWITEALILVTARIVYPRMIIRHFKRDALVFIRETPISIESGMLPPFTDGLNTRDSFWKAFCAYLSKCKSVQQFEPLEMTKGFSELCLAGKGTLQGFLISLSIYIEFCVNLIFSSLESGTSEEDYYKKKVENLVQHVGAWDSDDTIRERAKGLLSMLYKPSLSKRMDVLVEQGVITEFQKRTWKKARPYLAHGNVIDFKKEEEFWHIRNHLISMVYRLIFRIIGYRGLVLDYDGSKFGHIPYEWNDPQGYG
ncbi:MAG: hypothetical protein NTW65_12330 [Deltaproteobacteria bacterium]|nr:hypothetical protein [Deltaproteobacteria bacterium]